MRKIVLAISLALMAAIGITTPAYADDHTRVANYYGDDLKIKTVKSSGAVSYRYLVERDRYPYEQWSNRVSAFSSTNADNEVTHVRSRHDKRCIYWTGRGATDGWWVLLGNDWISLPDGVRVGGYAIGSCTKRNITRVINNVR